MAEPGSPISRLVDVAVFAPIGVVARLCDRLPTLAGEGRQRVHNQVRLARTVGRFAVLQGRRELDRRLDAMAEQRRLASIGPTGETGVDADLLADLDADLEADFEADLESEPVEIALAELDLEPAGGSGSEVVRAVVPDTATLPISDYDSLAASHVVARLSALGPAELDSIGAYEAANRGRRTILGKIQQLRSS
jgi:hypothetical protein